MLKENININEVFIKILDLIIEYQNEISNLSLNDSLEINEIKNKKKKKKDVQCC